jgi:hypothetical protein
LLEIQPLAEQVEPPAGPVPITRAAPPESASGSTAWLDEPVQTTAAAGWLDEPAQTTAAGPESASGSAAWLDEPVQTTAAAAWLDEPVQPTAAGPSQLHRIAEEDTSFIRLSFSEYELAAVVWMRRFAREMMHLRTEGMSPGRPRCDILVPICWAANSNRSRLLEREWVRAGLGVQDLRAVQMLLAAAGATDPHSTVGVLHRAVPECRDICPWEYIPPLGQQALLAGGAGDVVREAVARVVNNPGLNWLRPSSSVPAASEM